MENEKIKQTRSISVDNEIYNRFRTICTEKGLIMSVQFEHMMEKFIRENDDNSNVPDNTGESKNNLRIDE